MIDTGRLIKIVRGRGFTDWPEKVKCMSERIDECKLGFPGIGNDHMSLLEYREISTDELFIYDPYLTSDQRGQEYVPMMLKKLGENKYLVVGIGLGLNTADPRREIRWKDTVTLDIPGDNLVMRVDVRPKETGGPGYFYFFRAYRDHRI